MANPNPDYVYQCVVLGSASGQAINNVFHYDVINDTGVPPNTVDMTALATAFRALWTANITPRLSVEYEAFTYICTEFTGQIPNPNSPPQPPYKVRLGQVGQFTPPLPDAGSLVGDVMPTYVAVTAQKRTSFAGRDYRGSARFGPIIETNTVGNELESAVRTAWVAAVNGLLNLQVTSGGQTVTLRMAIFQKTRVVSALITLPLSAYAAEVTTMTVNRLIGSQISRKAKQGQGA